jgi:rare lipoprotein A
MKYTSNLSKCLFLGDLIFSSLLFKKQRHSQAYGESFLKARTGKAKDQNMHFERLGVYSIAFLFVCLLTSCQFSRAPHSKRYTKQPAHTSHRPVQKEQDGAPEGPLPTLFKKIIPKIEPLSRYGNPDSYHVDGRTYEVMTSSSGYRARGMASWYGTKFHKKRTSSGEDYNMYALTAAHRTLPLPSYVRVKNLSNGRQAIVRVNDRGPFHSGRVIDLSYAAAVKLGLLPRGTAPVEIEALSVVKPGKKAHVAHYYLQAGAFTTSQNAQALRGKLAKITPSPVFVEKYQHQYIVRVGPFANKRMTDRVKRALVHRGVRGAFSVLM